MPRKLDAPVEMSEILEAKSLNPNDTEGKPNLVDSKHSLNYFRELLKESVVTGLPQIITASNVIRRTFKIIVLVGCISGFVYQAVEFAKLYRTYPSSLEIELQYSRNHSAPTVTICSRNPVQKTKFCKDQPILCIKPTNLTKFCNKYPNNCNQNTTVDDLQFVVSDLLFIREEIVEMYGQKADEFISDCCADSFLITEHCRKKSKYTNYKSGNFLQQNCYIIDFTKLISDYSHEELMEIFAIGKESCHFFSPFASEDSYTVVVNLDPKEYTRPDRKVAAQAVVHTHNDFKNPFLKGFTIREGKRYTVMLSAFEENLLPAPYSTNCTENDKLDENYDREFCINNCTINFYAENCGCVPIGSFDTNIPECTGIESILQCAHTFDAEFCFEQCPRLCHRSYFEYTVSESDFENSLTSVDLGDGPIYTSEELANVSKVFSRFNGKGKSILNIIYGKNEVTVFSYKPKYEKIEILGYIGGFSGIWLGISLVAIFDLGESIIVFICWLTWKDKEKKNQNST